MKLWHLQLCRAVPGEDRAVRQAHVSLIRAIAIGWQLAKLASMGATRWSRDTVPVLVIVSTVAMRYGCRAMHSINLQLQ